MAVSDEEKSGCCLDEAHGRGPVKARRSSSTRLHLARAVPLIVAISLMLWIAIVLMIKALW